VAKLDQLDRLHRRQERRFGLDRRRVAQGSSGGRDRLGQCQTEVDPVAEDLNTVVMIVEPPTQL